MENIKIYFLALLFFTIIDYIWLAFLSKKMYQKELGHLLAKKVNYPAAIIFYLIYLVALLYFVINPAINSKDVFLLLESSAIFGFITYATYDLTNLASLKSWPLKITIIDILWGMFISVCVSYFTYQTYFIFLN